MTFTYNGTPDTDLEKVRLEIGDTDSATALFSDAEVNVKIADHPGSILLAAASLCDILSRRYARAYDFETDGQKFSRSQMSKQYAQLATELRQRNAGVEVDPTTRIDGYSDDIAYDETNASPGSRTGRVREGYFNPDLPF